ncbi:hypothetical protein F7725_013371, partial [Dissostichus mawsoni]
DPPATGGPAWVETAGATSSWLGHVPGIHRDSLFWLGNSWSVMCLWALQFAATGSDGGRQVFAEFNRVTSRNFEADFFEALDQRTPRFIQLFESKKGSVGQKLTELDTTRDEALSSVTVGVLTVLSEDSPQEGPSSMQLEPISTDIVLEGGIVMEKIKSFPQ